MLRKVTWLAVLSVAACGLATPGLAQDAPAAAAPAPPAAAATPAAAASSAAARGKFRVIAPGIEVTIKPDKQEEDTFSNHDVMEILQGASNLDWTPKLSPGSKTLKQLATGTVFRRKVWYLDFTFKPVRMLWVDVPQPSGKMQRKLIWYMVYHVKNPGGHLNPVRKEDGTFGVELVDEAVRFFPTFVLESHEFKKAYLDRVIPVALAPIQQKEDPNRPLLNSVGITTKPIPLSTAKVDNSVWGVATWEDLDPNIDFFSVSVQGLTNAYRWTDPAGAYKKGDAPGKGRELTQKTLLLNFWRPGEEYLEHERNIRFGIPGKVDYSWIYR